MTPREKVEKWFVAPLRVLRGKQIGDEGFLVLMVAISLAERIISSKKKTDKRIGLDRTFEECGSDFIGVREGDFVAFWNMYRNGLMHHAHPFSGAFLQGDDTFWDWDISDDYGALPEVIEAAPKKKVIRIDPWKWLEYILTKYDLYPDLIDLGDSRKLGDVHSVPGIALPVPSDIPLVPPPHTPKFDSRTGSMYG